MCHFISHIEKALSSESARLFSALTERILKNFHKENFDINLVLVDDNEIKELNEQYRDKEGPTDVLSFSQTEGEDIVFPGEVPRELGDVIVSIDRAAAQAEERGISLNEELGRLFIHGTLHLLGFDHERGEEAAEEMFALEDDYLKTFLESKA